MESTQDQTGLFSMDVVHQILATKSLVEAKALAKETVSAILASGKKVRKENVTKAHMMIDKARDNQNIAFGMSNFILAFQGEKVIK